MRQEQAPAVSSSSHADVGRGSTQREGPLRAAGYRVVWLFPEIGAHPTRERESASIVPHGRARGPRSTCPPHTVALRHRRRLSQPPGPLPSAPPGFFKDRPSASTHPVSTPAALRPLRHDAATRRARSVLAVPPRHDGFLHRGAHGLVASRSRPWGSPGFRWSVARSRASDQRPHRCLPFRAFPSREAVPTSPWALAPLPLPDVRPTRLRGLVPLENPWRPAAVADLQSSDALLGFSTWSPAGPRYDRSQPRRARSDPTAKDPSTDRRIGPSARLSGRVPEGRCPSSAFSLRRRTHVRHRGTSVVGGATAAACRAGSGRRSLCASIPEGKDVLQVLFVRQRTVRGPPRRYADHKAEIGRAHV